MCTVTARDSGAGKASGSGYHLPFATGIEHQKRRAGLTMLSALGQGRRSRAAVRGSALPQKADQPLLQSIISSVPQAEVPKRLSVTGYSPPTRRGSVIS